MSVHSCREYCDLHPLMHEVLKYDLADTSCWLDKDELIVELLKRQNLYSVLIAKLNETP